MTICGARLFFCLLNGAVRQNGWREQVPPPCRILLQLKGACMKRIAVTVVGIAMLGLPLAQSASAEVNVNVNVGVPAPPLPPLPVPPPLVLPAPPEFILPPALGVYVAVGVPHDLFYIGGTYYLYKDDRWYRGRYYNGPWDRVERRHIPPGLRKHKFERIRYYRDEEYRRYRDDHDHYRGRHFKPEKEWKEERKAERKEEKERRKAERREEKERRKEERRYEKEERKYERGEGHGRGRND